MDRWEGKRLNRPNDVVVPLRRQPLLHRSRPARALRRARAAQRRRLSHQARRLDVDGGGLRVPQRAGVLPDERTLYVANTRWTQYIHAFELDAGGDVVRRRIFADMSSDEHGRRARRDEGGRGRPDLLHGAWRHLGVHAGRSEARDHPARRKCRPISPSGAGSEDAVLHGQDVDLHAADEGARPAASLVPDAAGHGGTLRRATCSRWCRPSRSRRRRP